MKNILLSACCVLNFSVFAQTWEWAYPVNSVWGTQIRGVQADSSGNAYFMGRCTDTANTFNGANGSYPFSGKTFVVKYDTSGNIKWQSGAWGNAETNSMSIDTHSNCYLTGDFAGTAVFGTGTDTLRRTADSISREYFLVKLDKDGKALFFDKDGGNCYNMGTSVTAFSTDEIIVFWIDQTYCYYAGTYISHLNKLDSNGGQIWSLNSANSPYGIFDPKKITSTTDGGFLVSDYWFGNTLCFEGISDTLCLAPTIPSGITDVFLTKYSLNGDPQWTKSIRGINDQFEKCITTDSFNNIILAIDAYDTTYYDGLMLLPQDSRTTYIIKTDAFGNLINYIGFPGISSKHFFIKDLKSDSQGNIYLLGIPDTVISIGTNTIHFNQNSLAVIKLDQNMNYLWSQYAFQNPSYGSWDGLMSITQSYVYLGVNYNTPIFLNGSSYQYPAPNNSTTFDSFFAAIKNGSSVVTSAHEISNVQANIFPNPTSGIFTLNLKNKSVNTKICVSDLLGNCVLDNVSIKNNNQEIDLSNQAKGIYFMEITSGDERTVKKIVVQ